jgi:hypothetical protein
MSEDTASFLTVPEAYVTMNTAKTADTCTSMNIAGITQTDAIEMSEFHVDMLVDTPMKLELQVTLVSKEDKLENGTHRSIYHWDSYMLDAVGSPTSSLDSSRASMSFASGLVTAFLAITCFLYLL